MGVNKQFPSRGDGMLSVWVACDTSVLCCDQREIIVFMMIKAKNIAHCVHYRN